MLKQVEEITTQRNEQEIRQPHVFIQLSSDDFRRTDDGSWVTTREILITGATENQRMIKEGKEFKKGDLTLFGLDLAAILDKHSPQ